MIIVQLPYRFELEVAQNVEKCGSTPYQLSNYAYYYDLFSSCNKLSTGGFEQISQRVSKGSYAQGFHYITLPASHGTSFNLSITGNFFISVLYS